MKKVLKFAKEHATALSALGTGLLTHLLNDATFTTILAGTGAGSIIIRVLIGMLLKDGKAVSIPQD